MQSTWHDEIYDTNGKSSPSPPPSFSFFLFRPPTRWNKIFRSFSLSLSLPSPLSRAKSRIFTRHDRNFFVVDEYKFLFLSLPSPSIETRKISMSLLCALPCRARVSGDQRGRSSELFTLSRGIISVKMWTVSREEEWSFHGRDFCIRHRGRGRGEDIRTKTKFWGVYLTCFREYVMNRSVVDSSIIVEIFFFFFRWY